MVVLIAASLLFIVASATTLVWGWLNGQQTLIWTSIACSVLAGLLLLVAHFKTRRRPVIESVGATSTGTRTERRAERSRPGLRSRLTRSGRTEEAKPEAPAAPKIATTATETTTATSAPSTTAAATGGALEPEAAAAARTGLVGTTRSRTPSKPEPGPAPAKRASSRGGTSTATEVVAVAERKKFHRPECRYAKAKGAEAMSKANARRRGLAPCGICKP